MTQTFLVSMAVLVGAGFMCSWQVPVQRRRSLCLTGLNKSQAEECLDWLEANGYRDVQLSHLDEQGYSISFS